MYKVRTQVKHRRYELLGTRAKAYVHDVIYKWDGEIVFTLGGVHISVVFTMRRYAVCGSMHAGNIKTGKRLD